MEILGRDKLGRFIYAGDEVFDHVSSSWYVIGATPEGLIELLANGVIKYVARPEDVTVDLYYSPGYSNYERYFADLGTLEEVVDASGVAKFQCYGGCGECPFHSWGKLFDDKGIMVSCYSFKPWLDREATL